LLPEPQSNFSYTQQYRKVLKYPSPFHNTTAAIATADAPPPPPQRKGEKNT